MQVLTKNYSFLSNWLKVSQVTKSKQLIDQGSAKGQLSLIPVENLFDLFAKRIMYDKKLENFQYNNKTDAKNY